MIMHLMMKTPGVWIAGACMRLLFGGLMMAFHSAVDQTPPMMGISREPGMKLRVAFVVHRDALYIYMTIIKH